MLTRQWYLRFMSVILALSILTFARQPPPSSPDITALWNRAIQWHQFLDNARTQRNRWLQNWSRAQAPDDFVARLRKAAPPPGLLIVAEDWCPDSVNTVPYVVKLAEAAGIETRILNRADGTELMDRHRTGDGRRVTPLVVVVRSGRDTGAWIERPDELQKLFRGMAGDSEKARRFADRQAWYDADAGKSTQREIVTLIERTPAPKSDDMPSMADMTHHDTTRWHAAFDGAAFLTFDHQGGARGKTELRSQNWMMLMFSREARRSAIEATTMLSAEPFTVGAAGYSEIFQEGEAYRGLQVTDRQHPHDLFMELSAAWRIPVWRHTTFTIAGGPVGEAALGPVSFMHRPSSGENPTAPLSHHIFDSTHVTEGIVLGRVDHGPVALEGSLFRGREPDEHRSDLDLGKLDSWSVRGWFRPRPSWMIQVSHGFLHEPEQLEPGDQRRTNGSVSWLRMRGEDYTAATIAVGRTKRTYSDVSAVLAEATHRFGRTSVYGRFEHLSVETEILLFPQVVHRPHPGELVDPIGAITAGVVRDFVSMRSLLVGVGADATRYAPPTLLQITHGDRPISFHVFVRIARQPTQRMWNMTMGTPTMAGRHVM
jgi:hypothetical protein